MKYSWTISQLDCKIQDTVDGKELKNIVETIHWRYKLTDEDITVELYDATSLFDIDVNNFIEYENLTKQNVIDWLTENLDIEDLQKHLNDLMTLKKNPVMEVLPLPWKNE